ncbi:MAG: hypothetical protein DHS20C01_18120 [marine bacterium B5-7]|nr:MAG: hypothetical protein DHS20C01_18120 [marine bacterium B5-7]
MNILLCWELGGGSGHLEVPGDLAGRFLNSGHSVTLAARDVTSAARYTTTANLDIVQAPVAELNIERTAAVGYAEVLLRCGFRKPEGLQALVNAWKRLFELLQTDLIVVDHSPAAIIAARCAEISVAVTGSAFIVPPALTPLPPFIREQKGAKEATRRTEAIAVASINSVLLSASAKPIESLADLFGHEDVFLTTYPELDSYGERSNTHYWGTPNQLTTGSSPEWPRGKGEPVFVYMHADYPQFPVMVRQLGKLGHPTLIVAPGAPADINQQHGFSNIVVTKRHVNIDEVAGQCRVIIMHGGHGSVARVLRCGVAPIITPLFVEQLMLAKQLATTSLAFAAHPDPARHNYKEMVQAALENDAIHRNAAEFSDRHPLSECDAEFELLATTLVNSATQCSAQDNDRRNQHEDHEPS